ncbi:5-formyltetrahydrofolate cyclo-ligase [Mycolicibacter terrae]|uniref:5-formyltetrahydrofolate cyclo-ligase n=1 Tax=Mycolicibacter terrae TaxID=1788 RepID=A0AAD1HYH4_9MYCO|nr:5-formyltetrahydrofolate cyclo-ligase [Mycolicibacter terrae]BBX23724.1 5-formyltetrahydrofolate cyclo-ligase [Mycolicibacter terrae]SNV60566.1 5,10-methenyltetrahydrofolate synthetase [Mycolicibacter terrae]
MTDNSAVATKSAIRARVLEARRAVPPHLHDAEARALAGHLEQLAGSARTVCAYLPVGDEPGSAAMLDGLTRRGIRVLLPVVRTGDDGTPLALLWGDYRPDTLVSARFGLLEPAQPWLPAETLAEADLVLVPALALDRRGVRLGRGAGFYDRSLLLRRPRTPLVAVVRDEELLPDRLELPAEPHDVPMTHALTPGLGLVPLAGSPDGPGTARNGPECSMPNSGSST